ncbi:hypothetical protein BJ912DRAFT_1075239 [Pholiota molesta]|nr:hypothetical protein BJ912DRAFT_1075239 [Pholiota molesta]
MNERQRVTAPLLDNADVRTRGLCAASPRRPVGAPLAPPVHLLTRPQGDVAITVTAHVASARRVHMHERRGLGEVCPAAERSASCARREYCGVGSTVCAAGWARALGVVVCAVTGGGERRVVVDAVTPEGRLRGMMLPTSRSTPAGDSSAKRFNCKPLRAYASDMQPLPLPPPPCPPRPDGRRLPQAPPHTRPQHDLPPPIAHLYLPPSASSSATGNANTSAAAASTGGQQQHDLAYGAYPTYMSHLRADMGAPHAMGDPAGSAAAAAREGTVYGPAESEGEDSELRGRPKKKRRRQALSCTECKRRKIKCDRNHPCTPCKRRGEESACQWHSIEPVEKYATKAEFAHLRAEFAHLTARCEQLERVVQRLLPAAATHPSTAAHSSPAAHTLAPYYHPASSSMPSSSMPSANIPGVPGDSTAYSPSSPPYASLIPPPQSAYADASSRWMKTEGAAPPPAVSSSLRGKGSPLALASITSPYHGHLDATNPSMSTAAAAAPTNTNTNTASSSQPHQHAPQHQPQQHHATHQQPKNCRAQTPILGGRLRRAAGEGPASSLVAAVEVVVVEVGVEVEEEEEVEVLEVVVVVVEVEEVVLEAQEAEVVVDMDMEAAVEAGWGKWNWNRRRARPRGHPLLLPRQTRVCICFWTERDGGRDGRGCGRAARDEERDPRRGGRWVGRKEAGEWITRARPYVLGAPEVRWGGRRVTSSKHVCSKRPYGLYRRRSAIAPPSFLLFPAAAPASCAIVW